MAVPGYQHFMLPLLKIVSDQQEHSISLTTSELAEQLRLTEEDKSELVPSGIQTKLANRVSWACVYLTKAGLLERQSRGRYHITDRGLMVLQNPPSLIDNNFLGQFAEFNEFKTAKGVKTSASRSVNNLVVDGEADETPEESLDSSYQSLRRAIAQDLLDRTRLCSPRFFEKLVVDLLVAMGYGGSRQDAGQAIGKSGDDGIDGIIKEDKLGLDAVYIQAKRWQAQVGRPVVQAFIGSLEGQRARKGVLITTSGFTSDAREYVNRIEKKIVLIDGEQLAQFMIDHGIGVTDVVVYTIKKVDSDYFGEE